MGLGGFGRGVGLVCGGGWLGGRRGPRDSILIANE